MGYYQHKFKFSFALDDLTERGLPVDRQLQTELREYIDSQHIELSADLQKMIPDHLLPMNRKTAYKSLPKDLRATLKERDLLVPKAKLDYYYVNHYDVCNALGYYVVDIEGELGLVKLLPFNPSGSSPCTLNYIRYMVEVVGPPWYVPRHIDSGNETSGKEELEKLIAVTGDETLKLIQKMRKLEKLGGTYASGDWIPGEDGCVHGTFRFGTASGQISCTRPNIQQFPEHYDPNDEWITDLMYKVKGTIRAWPGYKLVKVDARGAHARMQGWLAEDADYYRLSAFDVHSYNTAHYVNHPLKNYLLDYGDDDLRRELKLIKKQYEHDRNFKLKRIAYLMQFGGGAEKAYRILSAGFSSPMEVQAMMDMISGLFPKTFRQFPKKVRAMLRKGPRIISPFNCLRWFWDGNMEEATAFLPSNCFHCHVQEALTRLFERGVFAKYGACNFAHDSLWLHCKDELVDEGIAAVKLELERPSEVLVNSLGPFWCSADAMVGQSLIEMEDV